jgi:GntR family transcriptional regulator, rspAB operon transcriptional repressor
LNDKAQPATSGARRSSRDRASLSDRAYYMIREQILRGKVGLGAIISRRKLAEELGMSFLPISEALQRLENEGLVESRPRAGTRVRVPTADEVRGRYVVREALEAESARLCCEHADFQQRLELRHMAGQIDTLYARTATTEADSDFLHIVHEHHLNLHMRIADHAGCRQLKEAIEKNHVLIYNWFFDVSAERRALPTRFHTDLLEVVTGDDPTAADAAMRGHVRWGLDSVLERLGEASAANGWRLKRDDSAASR